jgi:hypothetical protein
MMRAKDHGGGRDANPYCNVCTDSSGALLSYEKVLANMAEQRFMKVNGMPRKGAEEAAARALSAMPLWKDRARAST